MKLTNVSLAAAALLVLPAVVHAQSGRRQRDARPERDAAPTQQQGQSAQPSAAQSRQNPSTSPARAARMEDQYKLLLERSIFARSGTACGPRNSQTAAGTSSTPATAYDAN